MSKKPNGWNKSISFLGFFGKSKIYHSIEKAIFIVPVVGIYANVHEFCQLQYSIKIYICEIP